MDFSKHDFEVMFFTLKLIKRALPKINKASIELLVYNDALEKGIETVMTVVKSKINNSEEQGNDE